MRKSTRSELEQLVNDVHSHGINYKSREIYLHGAYSSVCEGDPGIEYQMATTFVKNVHLLNGQGEGTILVHMQSPGGEWYDGMAMFHAVRFSKSPVIILAYGQASSMSGILLQAADKRILVPDCEFMIHHGSIGFETNSIAAKSIIDSNERACKRMLAIFARRAKNGKFFKKKKFSEAQIVRFLDRKIHNKSDWYMTTEEALDFGFADGILGERGYENTDKLRTFGKYKSLI